MRVNAIQVLPPNGRLKKYPLGDKIVDDSGNASLDLQNCVVVAIRRGDLITPKGATRLRQGDIGAAKMRLFRKPVKLPRPVVSGNSASAGDRL